MCSPNSSGLPCPPLPAPRSTWMCWAPPTRWYRSRSRWVHLGGLCRAACCCTYHTSVRWPASKGPAALASSALPPCSRLLQYGGYQAAGNQKPGWGYNEGFKYITEKKVATEAGFSWDYKVRATWTACADAWPLSWGWRLRAGLHSFTGARPGKLGTARVVAVLTIRPCPCPWPAGALHLPGAVAERQERVGRPPCLLLRHLLHHQPAAAW